MWVGMAVGGAGGGNGQGGREHSVIATTGSRSQTALADTAKRQCVEHRGERESIEHLASLDDPADVGER